MYPAGVEQAHDERVNEVAELVFEAHGAAVADGEARGVEEIDLKVEEGFEQVGDGVGRIAVIAVERYDDVAGGVGEAFFVSAAVATDLFADDKGSEGFGYVGGAVGGVVVHDNALVDEIRHAAQDLFDALLFVEARDDDGDAEAFVQRAIVARGEGVL